MHEAFFQEKTTMKNLVWLKIFATVLVFSSLLVGLLVPLRTGIVSITPNNAQAGDTLTIVAEGYNTHYKSASKTLGVWLKLDSLHWLEAKEVFANDETHLRATFHLPKHLPNTNTPQEAKLVVSNQLDGTHDLASAIFIAQDSINTAAGQQAFSKAPKQSLWQQKGFAFPNLPILEETIRNLFYHVPLWFSMIILMAISVFHSIQYLRKKSNTNDYQAVGFALVGTIFGILGLLTGALWAKYTWGAFWSFDVKQNMSAVAVFIYSAYFVLRSSFADDEERRSKISAVYNIFAFVMLIPLLFVIPRLTESLHPGNGGNPGFNAYDLDNNMRLVFYPAVIGFTLLGVWMANLYSRYLRLEEKLED